MKRVFAIDVFVCDSCGGAMRILTARPDGDLVPHQVPRERTIAQVTPAPVAGRDEVLAAVRVALATGPAGDARVAAVARTIRV